MAKNHLEKSKNPAKEISKKNSKQKLQTTIKKPRNLSMKPPAKLQFFKNKQTAKKCKQTHEFLQDTLLYK